MMNNIKISRSQTCTHTNSEVVTFVVFFFILEKERRLTEHHRICTYRKQLDDKPCNYREFFLGLNVSKNLVELELDLMKQKIRQHNEKYFLQ